MERTWLSIGREYHEGDRRAQIEAAIAELDWAPYEKGMSLPFMQGTTIRAAVQQLGIPNVSALAWVGSTVELPDPADESQRAYYDLLGIEGNYTNGKARVYVLDTGTRGVPLASDFEERAVA